MTKILPVITCLILLLPINAHAAKIYKWRGPDGQMHYSSTPPPEAEAESTGMKTTTKKASDLDTDGDKKDLDKSISDEERIRRLEEKIEQLEKERLTADTPPKSGTEGIDSEEKLSEDDRKPDYSVQGQVRMLEEENRRLQMITRCKAKAPHGVDCSSPDNFEQY